MDRFRELEVIKIKLQLLKLDQVEIASTCHLMLSGKFRTPIFSDIDTEQLQSYLIFINNKI